MLLKLVKNVQTKGIWLNLWYIWIRKTLVDALRQHLDQSTKTILDVGCGRGHVTRVLKNLGSEFSFTGVDIEIFLEGKQEGTFENCLLCDGRYLPFREKSFDTVIALDFIEHLSKNKGEKFLNRVEKLARKQVIIFTPNGYLPQADHKSGWYPSEFVKRGYKVHGMRGFKALRRERARPKFSIIGEIISWMTQPVVYRNPELAYQILCLKKMGRSNERGETRIKRRSVSNIFKEIQTEMNACQEKSKPLVSIVTVHVSRPGTKYLTNWINSLEKSTIRDFEIIILFDSSTLKDADYISSNFPQVKVIVTEGKVKVSEGRNIAAKLARGYYLVFMDEDTRAEPSWLKELLRAAQTKPSEVGIFGSVEAPYDGEADYDGVHGVCDILGCSYGEKDGKYDIDSKYFHFEILGFAFLIKRMVFEEIGGWDPRFDLGVPELDLCWRARLEGYEIVKVSSAVVHHAGGFTKGIYQPKKVYFLERNTLATLVKNYSIRTLLFILPLSLAQLALETVFFCSVGKPNLGFSVLKAVFWNIKHAKDNWIWHQIVQRNRKVSDRKIMRKFIKKNLKALKLRRYWRKRKQTKSSAKSPVRLEYARAPYRFGLGQSIYVKHSLPVIRQKSGLACDVGCNICELERNLPEGMEYVGIDLSREALRVATKTNRILCDARTLPFRDKTFDVVFAYEILEHLPDSEAVVKEVSRVIKKTGEFIVSVPNGKSPFARMSLAGSEHIRWFTPSSLDELLWQFGFVSKNIENDVWLPILKVKLGKWVRIVPTSWHEFIVRICYVRE